MAYTVSMTAWYLFKLHRDDDEIVDPPTLWMTLCRRVHTGDREMSESTSLVCRLTGSTSATSPSNATASVSVDQNQTEKQESECESTLDNLLSMFVGDLSPKEVIAVYRLTDEDYNSALDCLLSGSSLHDEIVIGNPPQSSMWTLIFGLILLATTSPHV